MSIPKYKESNVRYEAMPKFTTAAAREGLASLDRLNQFLDQTAQYFGKKGEEYAQEKGIEYAVRNPITKDRVLKSMQTGDNPIPELLVGGKSFNDAAKSIFGQQVSGALRIDFDRNMQDVLYAVEQKQITNAEELASKLEEPIKAHVEYLNTIDPRIAEGYANSTANAASNAVLRGNMMLKKYREEEYNLNAEATLNNFVRDYSNYRLHYKNADSKQIGLYKDALIKTAVDTSFSMTSKNLKHKENLQKELKKVDFSHVAKQIAAKNVGKSLKEVMDSLPKDKSVDAEYYNNLDLTDKDALRSLINSELSILNSDLQGRNSQLTSDVQDLKLFLNKGKSGSNDLIDRILENADPESKNGKAALALVEISDSIELWNRTPYPDVQAEFAALDAKMKDINYTPSVPEMTKHDTMGEYLANLSDGLNKDYTKTALERDGNLEVLDFSDPYNLKKQVDKRVKDLYGSADRYGAIKEKTVNKLLTKSEADMFVATYQASDGNGRVALLQTIDSSFGRNSSKVIAQLSSHGLPFTAQLSSYLNNPIESQKFLSLDDKEEQDILKKSIADRKDGLTFQDIRTSVRSNIAEFEEVIMKNYSFDANKGRAKIDSIVETLSLYAAQELNLGKGRSDALDAATDLINKNFSFQETYHIPLIVNGDSLSESRVGAIIDKANYIKDNARKFGATAFRSSDPSIPDQVLNEEMQRQMDNFGEWRNTADGNGLVYGIVFPDGSFSPVVNNKGERLSFEFTDLRMVMPHTDIPLVQTTNTEVGFGFNPSSNYYGDVKGAIEKFEQEKKKGIPQDMYRADGSIKSANGFLGPIEDNFGRTMTEFSIGIPVKQPDGSVVEMEVPSLVPGLTKAEIEYLKTDPDPSERNKLNDSIAKKAAKHAAKRLKDGKSVYYQDGE
jgi:hypothetical protein